MMEMIEFAWAHRPEILATQFVLIALLAAASKVPLSYNMQNLLVRVPTTLMTTAAFVLVVGLLIVMLAFVNGMYTLTQTSGQPGNVILLADGATDEQFSSLAMADVGDIANQPGIRLLDGKPMVSRETYIVINQPIENPPPGRQKRRFLQVRGVDDPVMSAAVHGLKLERGGDWFGSAGVTVLEGADETSQPGIEVLLGAGIARELGRDRWPEAISKAKNQDRLDVGDTFRLSDRTWVVAGVFQASGSSYDSEVWAKQSLVGPLFGKENYSSLIARTENAVAAEKLKEYFLNDYSKAKLAAIIETEYFEKLSQTNVQFLLAIIVVATFTAIGGIFGVMNTMFAAIGQRTKDIGVLRLLGYKRWQILVSFLLESLVLSLVGGVIGCALGYLCDGATATSIVSSGQGGGKFVVLRLTVDLAVLSTGMLLALFMGFFGGLIPSLSAMRLTALEALR
jgi:ABC-type lipoprotein release transport system permease subunit